MGKLLKKILGIGCATLIGCSALLGCGGGGGGGGGSNAGVAGGIDNYQWVEDPDFQALDLSERAPFYGGDGGDDGVLTYYNWNAAPLNSAKNSAIYAKLKQAANGLDIEAVAPASSEYESTIAMKQGANELPDIFTHYGPERPQDYADLIEFGQIVPVSDFVSEDKFPNIYNHLKKFDYLRGNLPYADGRHWSIPVDWTMEHTMYVRLDWIQNLNNKLDDILTAEGITVNQDNRNAYRFTETGPQDLLEFYRLARAMKLYDPDNDGNNNTTGYTSSVGDDFFADCWIFEAFDAGYDRMVKIGNQYVPSWANDNTKLALAFMNNLVKNGYMSDTYASNKTDDKQKAFIQGKVGMIEAHAWYNTILRSFQAYYSESESWTLDECAQKVGMFNPPKGQNGSYGINGNPNFWTVTCISAGLDDTEMEAAFELMDYMLSEEGKNLMIYGIEGVHYTLDNTKPADDITRYVAKDAILQGKDAYGFNNTLEVADAGAVAATLASWSSTYFSPYQSNAAKIIAAVKNADTYARFAEYPFLSPQAYIDNWDKIRNTAERDYIDIIGNGTAKGGLTFAQTTWANINNLATSDVNSKFDELMANFNSNGGQDLIDEYNETVTPTTAVRFTK